MGESSQLSLEAIVAACREGAGEAAGALGRALDAPGIAVQPGTPGAWDAQCPPAGSDGPGLVVVLVVGPAAALVVVPAAGGFVPAWCAEPDATGASKLTTLAQELGMILLPDELEVESFEARWVAQLGDAVARAGVPAKCPALPLELTHEGRRGAAWLLWPAASARAALTGDTAPLGEQKPAAAPKETPQAGSRGERPRGSRRTLRERGRQLPIYSKSLLRIKVPLVVTLARKRQPLGRIVELGPGSIIQFDKSCEEMLDLEIGDCRVASGEAVKMGDKFGLRITSMVLPEERFYTLTPPS